MSEPAYSDLTDAALKVRATFVNDFTAAAGARLLSDGSDLSPIMIRYSCPGFGIQSTMKRVIELYEGYVLDFDIAISASKDEAVDDINWMLDKMNRTRRLILIHGWEANEHYGRAVLAEVMKKRRPDDLVVIQAFFGKDQPTTLDIDEIIGKDLWDKMTYIEVDLPEILDAKAIARLPRQPD